MYIHIVTLFKLAKFDIDYFSQNTFFRFTAIIRMAWTRKKMELTIDQSCECVMFKYRKVLV